MIASLHRRSVDAMKKILVIGIGPGHPEQITVQAINALRAVDVFFVIDKREETADLVRLRRELCERYATTRPYRFVTIPDPPRDRDAAGYGEAVVDWHRRRAAALREAIDGELGDGETGGFLAWGDPSLYDSILRILEPVAADGAFGYDVIPGVTSVQALAASHRIPLNRIGEPVLITTGRKLAAGWTEGVDDVAVMLDGTGVFADLADELGDDDLEIYWGAYVGTDDELLVHGPVRDVADEIVRTRADARARKGWVMDTYLLRRHRADDAAGSE
jgi:precorrin-6A synthase